MNKILAFVMVCFFSFAPLATAAGADLGFFTIDAPGDWDVVEKSDSVVVISAPDKTLAFSVMKLPLDASPKETAEALAKHYNSTNFAKMDGEGEYYDFNLTMNGVDGYCQIWPLDDKSLAAVAILGDHDGELANKMFESLEYK